MEKLPSLEDGHLEFTLLRACLGACRLIYVLRGIGVTPAVQGVLAEADRDLREALERVLGSSVDEQAWAQAGLRTSDGGMGVRHPSDVAVPAFLGSVASNAVTVATVLGRQSVEVPGTQQAAAEFLQTVQAEEREGWQTKMDILRGPLDADSLAELGKKPQPGFQEAVDRKLRQDLLARASGNAKDRLEAVGRKHAGAWLECFPTRAVGLHMGMQDFRW